MKISFPHCLTLAAVVASATIGWGARSAMAAKTVSTNPKWKHLVNSYFDDVYLRYNPTTGTSAGLHQYDAKLEDYSHSSLDAQDRRAAPI